MSVVFKKPQDLQIIKSILQKNSLPYQDVETGKIDFFLAYEDESFIGIVGLEKFKNVGLLRSMVVVYEYRGKGYGKEICRALMHYAKDEKITELYLLTCTAKEFFEKLGFEVIERNSVPDKIKTTTEFTSLCPASAVCLRCK